MKKLIFLLVFIISINEMKSQYLLYPPQQQIYTYTDTNYNSKSMMYINSSMPRFQFNTFTLGWHWSSARTMSENLLFSMGHSGWSLDINTADKFKNNVNLVHNANDIGDATYVLTPMNSMCILWKPTLLIDTNNLGLLQTRQFDTIEKPIFGFRNVLRNVF